MTGARIPLRIASILAFLQGVAHGLLIASYSPRHGPAETTVVSAMQTNFFHFGGPWAHSYWELYTGYAWMAAVTCLVQGAVFWIISSTPENRTNSWLIGVFVVANLSHAILVVRFFFFTPLVPDLLVVLFLCLALRSSNRNTEKGVQ